jgi:hypothetical protein
MRRSARGSLYGIAAALLASAAGAQLLDEGFESVAGLEAAGWHLENKSEPIGTTDWFQGNSSVFPAFDGSTSSYLGANFDNVAGPGTISNWAITPVLPLLPGDSITFYTRTVTAPAFPDRLELWLSVSGASTDTGEGPGGLGAFSTFLLSINPTLTTVGYPTSWFQFEGTVPALPGPRMGRFGFSYYVTDAGDGAANGDYIGIDRVVYSSDGIFFDGFEGGHAAAWSAVGIPLLAQGSATIDDHEGFDFVTGGITPIHEGDLYYFGSYENCDDGPATWGNNFEQGDGVFVSDLQGPLSGFQAPDSGYSGQFVCIEAGGVYVYRLDTPAGRYAFFRVLAADATSMSIDYQVR